MGSPSRSLALAALLALLAPAVASAQGAQPAGTPPPPGGGAPAPGLGGADTPGSAAPADKAEKKPTSSGNIGGVTFQDKVTRRAPAVRAAIRRGGPLATFPGFESLPDGGSRFFVQLSQSVPVEERRAPGSITYVLKGAHLRVRNDANSLVTVHFNTPVFRARLTPHGNDLLFVLELRSAASPTFKVSDNQDKSATLQIDFPKGDFLGGEGSETVPSERPNRALGKVPKGAKGNKGAPPPPPVDTQAPTTGEPGPNP